MSDTNSLNYTTYRCCDSCNWLFCFRRSHRFLLNTLAHFPYSNDTILPSSVSMPVLLTEQIPPRLARRHLRSIPGERQAGKSGFMSWICNEVCHRVKAKMQQNAPIRRRVWEKTRSSQLSSRVRDSTCRCLPFSAFLLCADTSLQYLESTLTSQVRMISSQE